MSDSRGAIPSPRQSVTRTLVRGLEVLETIATTDGDDGIRLSDLAAAVDLDKATTSRLVRTLCEFGYAYQDAETKRYRLAGRILDLASRFEASLDLPKRARPFLSRLQEDVDETIHLGIREGDHIVYIAKLETRRVVKIASDVGQQNPLHSTALGKAILSSMPEDDREELLGSLDLKPQTENTITDVTQLRKELAQTAERGYSIDDRENEDTIICVGAPITGRAGRVVAAISISGPAFRMEQRVHELAEHCVRTAEEIGTAL